MLGGRIQITPLVDIVFLLLLFFMLTQAVISSPGIPVDLPAVLTIEDIASQKGLTITITKENIIYLNDKIATIEEISDELKKIKDEPGGVFIKADRDASLGRVVEVLDICRQENVQKINIATTPGEAVQHK